MSVVVGLCWLALAALPAWILLGLTDARARRRLPRVRQQQPEPRIPHWARMGHATPTPPASGRHARRTTR